MSHCAIISLHPMVGVDIHNELLVPPPPPPAPPIVPVPHIVGIPMYSLPTMGAKTFAIHGHVTQRGCKVTNIIPHVPIPPNACGLVLAIFCGSSAKHHFGAASVMVEGTPIGCALVAPLISVTLNCGFPGPMPTGQVIAPNAVLVGMTWADIVGGCFAMCCDAALQTVFSALVGSISNPWVADLVRLIASGPVGLAPGSKSQGPVGQYGRVSSIVSSIYRGVGELVGGLIDGTSDQGVKTLNKAWDDAKKELLPVEVGQVPGPTGPVSTMAPKGALSGKSYDDVFSTGDDGSPTPRPGAPVIVTPQGADEGNRALAGMPCEEF